MRNLKFKSLWWHLACLLSAAAFVGCNNADKEDNAYQGIIESYTSESDTCCIRVVYTPSGLGANMPKNKDLLYVDLEGYVDKELTENQKIRFSIISAENRPNTAIYDWGVWVCKIKVY